VPACAAGIENSKYHRVIFFKQQAVYVITNAVVSLLLRRSMATALRRGRGKATRRYPWLLSKGD